MENVLTKRKAYDILSKLSRKKTAQATSKKSQRTLTNKQQCNLENSRDKDFQARSAWEDDWGWLVQVYLQKDIVNRLQMRKHLEIERGRASLLASLREDEFKNVKMRIFNQKQ